MVAVPGVVTSFVVPETTQDTSLSISWSPPAQGSADNYTVNITSNSSVIITETVKTMNYTATVVQGTNYTVTVLTNFGGLSGNAEAKTALICKCTLISCTVSYFARLSDEAAI